MGVADMKRFKWPILVMLGILILFCIVGGLPRPGDIQWKQYTWTYADRDGGVIRYVSSYGGEFTVDRQSGGKFILGIDGRKYDVSVDGSQITVSFPDGRNVSATVAYFDDYPYFPFVDDNISRHDGEVFRLAAEADRVFEPKGGYITLALFIMALGVVHYGYPLACARFELSFRSWMIKDPEPTEEYVLVNKIFGGIFLVGGWLFLLLLIWK